MVAQQLFEQHPIPQNVSSYQFKLVGDMTLKQFFQVAVGVIISLIIYSTELYAIIKWPLILSSFLFGIALAFFPFQDRPLEKWIVLFFKSIYSPTQFKWNATATKINYFKQEEGEGLPPVQKQNAHTPAITQQTTIPAQTPSAQTQALPQTPAQVPPMQTDPNKTSTAPTQTPTPTQTAPAPQSEPALQPKPKTTAPTPIETTPKLNLKAPVQEPVVAVPEIHDEEIPITKRDKESKRATKSLEQKEKAFLSTLSEYFKFADTLPSENVNTPVINTIVVDTQPQVESKKEKGEEEVSAVELATATSAVAPITKSRIDTTISSDFAPPVPPARANLIAGQVMDNEGKIVVSAILEIRDVDNRPARAIRTNQLGHFSIVTPLLEGKYLIRTEKEGLVFDPVDFEVKNEIIPPIIIQAKSSVDSSKEKTIYQN